MDDLTRERYGDVIPFAELFARPRPRVPALTREDIVRHRIGLCGTADLSVNVQGGDQVWVRDRRLIDAIRRWKA